MIKTFEETIQKEPESKMPSFENVLELDLEDFFEKPETIEIDRASEIVNNVAKWSVELGMPVSEVRQNYEHLEKWRFPKLEDVGLPTNREELTEMRAVKPEEIETGILSKIFAYEPAAKPSHYWDMSTIERAAFDIYMAGGNLLDRIGGTITTEMGLTKKSEVKALYDHQLTANPKWYQKSPEGLGWAAEKIAEYYALKAIFKASGLHKVLTWAGEKAAHPFITKAIVARGGVKVLPVLSKEGLKRLTLNGTASFLRFAPENTAFLASWAAGSATLKGEDIGEAAIAGAIWGLGFSVIMPAAGGLGKMAIATKCGQKFQRVASIAYTNLWIKHPRLMNMGRKPFSDEWLAEMQRQYKARFGIDPTAADMAMMKKMTRMVGQELNRVVQKDAAYKAYWETGKKPVPKPPTPEAKPPTEIAIKPPVVPIKPAVEVPIKPSIVAPKPITPAKPTPIAPKPEVKAPAVKVEKKFYTSVPEEWQKEKELYDWGIKGLRTKGNVAVKVKGQRPRKTFIWQNEFDEIPVGVPKFLKEVKKRTDEVWTIKKRKGQYWPTDHYLAPKQVVAEVKKELGEEVFKPIRKVVKKPTVSEMARQRHEEIVRKAEKEGLLALDDDEFEAFINKNDIVPDSIERHEAGFVDLTPVVEGFERAHDWVLTFGEVKRNHPQLYKKLMKSYAERSAAVEKAISEVENSVVKNIQLSEVDNAQLSLIYEDKRLSLPDELDEYAELLDKGRILMDRLEEISLKEGIFQRPFQERMIEELTEKRESLRAKLKHPAASRQIQELTYQITTLENMRYLPHNIVARRVIEEQLMTLTGERRKTFIDKLSRLTAKFKKRKGKLFLKDYLAEEIITEKDIGFTKLITEALSDYYYRSSLKNLYDYAKANKLIKPISKALRQEGWLNQREIGIISPELKEQLVHPLLASALAEMKDMRRGRVGMGREIMSMVKIGQFIKPTIIWVYNTVQKYMRGMYSLNPVKEATSLARAFQAVITKDSLYHDLNASNLYQFPYEVSKAGRDEQIKMFIRKHQKETNRLISLTERALGRSLAKEDIDTFRKFARIVVPFAHRFVANTLTWTGDKVQRTQSYLILRKLGYPHEEAVKVASHSHAAYSTISHKFKKVMSPLVFVYSFRILMPIEIGKTLVEPMKAAAEYFFKDKKPPRYKMERWAKALTATVILPILVDTYMQEKGFEPEGKHLGPLAWKYKKIVEVDGEEREIIVGLNYILNLPVKYWNRLTYDNPITPRAHWADSLLRILKWEIHPVGRIFFWDILQNKRSFGTGLHVYEPEANSIIQIGQVAKYVFGQGFRFWGGVMDAVGEGEMTEKERAEQGKIFDEALSKFDRILFSVFGYKYTRLPLEERQSIMASYLIKEFKSRAFDINRRYEGDERDKRLANLERWFEKCEKWINEGIK